MKGSDELIRKYKHHKSKIYEEYNLIIHNIIYD